LEWLLSDRRRINPAPAGSNLGWTAAFQRCSRDLGSAHANNAAQPAAADKKPFAGLRRM